jgi:general secretion pathway protein B
MSVILDALKKLDRERLSRRNGAPNIAVEILRTDLPRPRKRILPYFVVVSIATAAITYVLMAEFGFLWKSSPPTSMNSPASSQPSSSAPSEFGSLSESSLPTLKSSPASAKQASLAPSEPAKSRPPLHQAVTSPAPGQSPEPVLGSGDKTMEVIPKIKSETEIRIPSVSPDEKKTTNNLISEGAKVAPANTVKLPEQIPYRSTTTPLSLRISGIIWSEESSNRIAVVNGTTLTEGSVIEGVKVVEIQPTRVRFLHNDRPFEIPLGVSHTLD